MEILKISTPGCGQCMVIAKRLEKEKIPYREVAHDTTEYGLLIHEYDIKHVPALIVRNGENVMVYRTLPQIIGFINHLKR